jgi:hypothetical protein
MYLKKACPLGCHNVTNDQYRVVKLSTTTSLMHASDAVTQRELGKERTAGGNTVAEALIETAPVLRSAGRQSIKT